METHAREGEEGFNPPRVESFINSGSCPESQTLSNTWYKNHLQEYSQRSSIGLPVYKTVSEGPPHAPKFRSLVWIDGVSFTTPFTYPTRKAAEQEAAKFAFIGIRQKVKKEASSRILTDTIFCKSIINEYAVKMNLGAPTYVTKETKTVLPIFVSTLYLNGVAYAGDIAKTRKEAEQLGARSAVKSILDSESDTAMCEIVRSKFKFFDALKNDTDSIMSAMNMSDGTPEDSGVLPSVNNKRKDTHLAPIPDSNPSGSILSIQGTPAHLTPIPGSSSLGPIPAIQGTSAHLAPISVSSPSGPIQAIQGSSAHLAPILESGTSSQILAIELAHPQQTSEQQPIVQATHQPFHEFKRQKPQTSLPEVELPILFVPPIAAQASGCSAAARKRKRKKERKRGQLQSSLPMARIPQNRTLETSMAQ